MIVTIEGGRITIDATRGELSTLASAALTTRTLGEAEVRDANGDVVLHLRNTADPGASDPTTYGSTKGLGY